MVKYFVDELYLIGEFDGKPVIYNAAGGFPIDYDSCIALSHALTEYTARGKEEIDLLCQRGMQELLTPHHSRIERVPASRVGFVYLLECNLAYKIGIAQNVEQRVQTMQVGTPDGITVICTISTNDMHKLEKELHTRFADKRRTGEWFDLSPDDVEYIKAMANG